MGKKFEIDIFVPSLNLAIEYDGHHHTKNNVIKHDELKNRCLSEMGIQLIRIRQNELPEIKSYHSYVIKTDDKNLEILKVAIKKMFHFILEKYELDHEKVEKIEHAVMLNINEHQFKIIEQIYLLELERSLEKVNPELSMEWHPTKNGKLLPSHSNKVVWWKCRNGHEWAATIDARYLRNNGCHQCMLEKNNIAVKHPDLIGEWDTDKNGELTPYKVSYGSTVLVWWKCSKDHSWQEQPQLRIRGLGCPFCAGKRVSIDNCLAK